MLNYAPYNGLHHLKELEAYVEELKAERSKGKSGIISISQ